MTDESAYSPGREQTPIVARPVGETESNAAQIKQILILDQLEQLQKKRLNLSNTLAVLAVTVGLFIALGMRAWGDSWQWLLKVVVILFFHEAGHFAAMRLFGYRNVQMFFIPLLGAAVSGVNYTAPGWKKVVVALAGPLPGIGVGVGLGLYALVTGQKTLIEFATLMLFLNGLQLLPVLPLDGGRVMQAVLFSRHYTLNLAFHALATMALLAIGIVLRDLIVLFLGVFMVIGLSHTYSIGRITSILRAQGLHPGSRKNATLPAQPRGGSNTAAPLESEPMIGAIPHSIAVAMMQTTRAHVPKSFSAKQTAQTMLNVYEALTSRPPGILASLGLTFLHVAAFMVAFVMTMYLVIGREGDFMDLLAARRLKPQYMLDPNHIEIHDGPQVEYVATHFDPNDPNSWTTSLVATFNSIDQARDKFTQLEQDEPGWERAVLIEQTVIVSFVEPNQATQWLQAFELDANNAFVQDRDGTGGALILSCWTGVGERSDLIMKKLNNFFDCDRMHHLIPPWVEPPLDPRSNEARAAHESTRSVYARLSNVDFYDYPEIDALQDKLSEARQAKDEEALLALSNQLSEQRAALYQRELSRIRDEEIAPEHHALVDRYIEYQVERERRYRATYADDDPNAWRALYAWQHNYFNTYFAAPLGAWPDSTAADVSPLLIRRHQQSFGFCDDTGLSHFVIAVYLEEIEYAAPVLIKWLEKMGVRRFKYELRRDIYDDFD